MPWQETSIMAERVEFVRLAEQEGIAFSDLCRQFGISRKTGYKWLGRYARQGPPGLVDQSRRPATSPAQTPAAMEERVVALRDAHPAWGGRKLHHRLVAHGVADVPSPSTITQILRRHGRLDPQATSTQRAVTRFEHPEPNDLWQLDFMGHLPLERGRVHPLSLLDDHSRFAVGLVACATERQSVVQSHLIRCFERYGLPRRILTDNGPPWGTSGAGGLTALEVWLIRLGIRVSHGRPAHPQTQGKVERWHRTIHAEVFRYQTFPDLAACQQALDRFRDTYNLERPHAALDHLPPVRRYHTSPRQYPATLPPIEYGPDDLVRTVNPAGIISVACRRHFVGRGLAGQPVALRPTATDGVLSVHYCAQQVGSINLHTDPSEV